MPYNTPNRGYRRIKQNVLAGTRGAGALVCRYCGHVMRKNSKYISFEGNRETVNICQECVDELIPLIEAIRDGWYSGHELTRRKFKQLKQQETNP